MSLWVVQDFKYTVQTLISVTIKCKYWMELLIRINWLWSILQYVDKQRAHQKYMEITPRSKKLYNTNHGMATKKKNHFGSSATGIFNIICLMFLEVIQFLRKKNNIKAVPKMENCSNNKYMPNRSNPIFVFNLHCLSLSTIINMLKIVLST